MKKRVISVIIVLGVVLTIFIGNKAQATERGIWFVFTSFGEIEQVEITNVTNGASLVLKQDELFDYETKDFIHDENSSIVLVKKYLDGTVINQRFDIEGVKSIVGIYDDGTVGESWMEIDEKYIY